VTQISAVYNDPFEQIATLRIFSEGPRTVLAITKEKALKALKFGLAGALSVVATVSTMCLVGVAMNLAYN
jgi:hypothetical protein